MEVKVSGIHFQVGNSLTEYCEQKVAELEKYSVNIVSADISFSHSESSNETKVEIILRVAGLIIKATDAHEDAYSALDGALAKAEKQVAKYKNRIKKHHKRREEPLEQIEMYETHSSFIEEESLEEAPEDIFSEYLPKIERKEVTQVQTLTVDEAVMQMDLLQTNFFIFQNINSKDLNIVYREKDGSNQIGWIEPKVSK